MKKQIVIEILLLFVLAVLIAISTNFLQTSITHFNHYHSENYEVFKEWGIQQLVWGIFALLACIADIAVMVLVALKDFKLFMPLIEKHNARKAQIAAARAAKADADKQKRIEELQAELDDLQDKTNSNP